MEGSHGQHCFRNWKYRKWVRKQNNVEMWKRRGILFALYERGKLQRESECSKSFPSHFQPILLVTNTNRTSSIYIFISVSYQGGTLMFLKPKCDSQAYTSSCTRGKAIRQQQNFPNKMLIADVGQCLRACAVQWLIAAESTLENLV